MKYLFTEESATEVVMETAAAEATAPEAVSPEALAPDTPVSSEGFVSFEKTEAEHAEDAILTVGAVDGETVVLLAGAESAAAPTETVATTEAAPSLGFAPMNFVENLQYMGVGMLTIFVVIGVIILSTMGINKLFSKKKDEA